MRPRRSTLNGLRVATVLIALFALVGQTMAAAGRVRTCQVQLAQSAAAQYAVSAEDCCPSNSDKGMPCEPGGKGQLPGKSDSCSACKAGYNCKNPQPYEPGHASVLLAAPVGSPVSTPPLTLLASPSPTGLWRPPTLI